MAKRTKATPNPQVPGLQRVKTASRKYVVNDRQTLRPMERVLRREPQTSRHLVN